MLRATRSLKFKWNSIFCTFGPVRSDSGEAVKFVNYKFICLFFIFSFIWCSNCFCWCKSTSLMKMFSVNELIKEKTLHSLSFQAVAIGQDGTSLLLYYRIAFLHWGYVNVRVCGIDTTVVLYEIVTTFQVYISFCHPRFFFKKKTFWFLHRCYNPTF